MTPLSVIRNSTAGLDKAEAETLKATDQCDQHKQRHGVPDAHVCRLALPSSTFYKSDATRIFKRDNSYLVQAVSQRQAIAEVPSTARMIYSFEPVIGALLSIAAAPVLVAAAGAVFALSGRSPFVAHLRMGTGGTPFWMWKLRTMWDAEEAPCRRWELVERIAGADVPEDKIALDPRVTSRFAAFCRRYSIDELPQLLHVITGQMSLVGPRPITPGEFDRYYGDDAVEVLRLRSGVTGLWQVSGRNRLTYRERRKLDLHLVRHFSVWLYLAILLRTIPKVLSGADSR
jgi:lipopolysaccharide/colanic/teichoic acid biosynthesis glycosyltransferase